MLIAVCNGTGFLFGYDTGNVRIWALTSKKHSGSSDKIHGLFEKYFATRWKVGKKHF